LTDRTNTTVPSLISKERMEKLELLIHLTSNLTQLLVLCGPEGIGKTTLLKVFQESKIESWRYCPVLGSADLSFEAIQGQLARLIKQDNTDTPVNSLPMVFEQYQNQHRQIVLIIDNAGELVPGLTTMIIRYAKANPALRVIFAFTQDELQAKQRSDRAVDDCHTVEIPYLSEKQCGEFLLYLASKSAVNGSVKASAPYPHAVGNAISESMIANIYQKTNGIPGGVVAEFARLFSAKKSGKLIWKLMVAVAILIAIALGVQWPASSKNQQITPAAVEQKADSIEITLPQPEPHVVFELPPPVQPVINQPEQSTQINEDILAEVEDEENLEPSAEINTPSGESAALKATPAAESAVVIGQKQESKAADAVLPLVAKPLNNQETQKQPDLSKSIKKPVPSVPKKTKTRQAPKEQNKPAAVPSVVKNEIYQEDGAKWLSSQPSDNYTLQLMVSSKQPSLKDIRKKYPALGQGFRAVKKVVDGKETFILLYGSFNSAKLANTVKQSLSADFRNVSAKKISSLKQ
jgi:DamX protein